MSEDYSIESVYDAICYPSSLLWSSIANNSIDFMGIGGKVLSNWENLELSRLIKLEFGALEPSRPFVHGVLEKQAAARPENLLAAEFWTSYEAFGHSNEKNSGGKIPRPCTSLLLTSTPI